MEPVRSFCKDSLAVRIYADRTAMGAAAARDGAALLRRLLAQQDTVRAVFAAAPSQNEFLEALCAAPDIDWKRVTAFHMDEYVGLDAAAPQGFGNFLRARVFDRLPFGQVCYLTGNAPDVEAECSRYAGLLAQAPIDIVFMGIGENGHIAFNDPPVAEFDDPAAVKVVALDEVCRNQQVHDGCRRKASSVHRSRAHQSKSCPRHSGRACLHRVPGIHPSHLPWCGALSGARERPASDGGIRS